MQLVNCSSEMGDQPNFFADRREKVNGKLCRDVLLTQHKLMLHAVRSVASVTLIFQQDNPLYPPVIPFSCCDVTRDLPDFHRP